MFSSAAELTPGEFSFFENNIRPLLSKHCYSCHSHQAERLRGGLYLDTRDGVLKGGDNGPAIVPGDPEKSLLIRAVRYTDPDLQMPPKGERLSAAQVKVLESWVRLGAPDPRTEVPKGSGPRQDPKDHWAFKPIKKVPVPAVARSEWVATPVDAFILRKLEDKAMHPSSPADRRTLIRRATYDLTGLPPTPEDVDAFVADTSKDAFKKVVDRLLDSPHYGERWGRHWLDVARYAETRGDINPRRDVLVYPFAWTYRDYVIQAFNQDKPFNKFILEQIAADRLGGAGGQDKTRLAALGFLTVGNRFNNNRNDIINDQIDVVSKAFLGLTVSCARCHDHKFDPIPTKDYYSLHGIFASTVEPTLEPIMTMPERNEDYIDYEGKRKALAEEQVKVENEVAEMRKQKTRDEEFRKKRVQLQRQFVQTRQQIVKLEMTHPGAPARAMAVEDAPRSRDSRVFVRGEAENKGDPAPRRFLECLSGPSRPQFHTGSGRHELAQAIASPSNPLTARVLVNRVWEHHFGRGIVPTPDDLGTMSEAPSHPDLIDYLARTFMESGWSIKNLHRMIMLSNTYQQSSDNNPEYAEIDPQNRLLWRANVQRLEIEALRDSLLAIGGVLDPASGGRPFELTKEPFIPRRTVYGFMSRNEMPELLSNFDMANPDMPTGMRYQTAVPQQALFLMNSPLVVEQAKNLVARDEFYEQTDDDGRINYLYRMIFQRAPESTERELGVKFLAKQPSGERVRPTQTPKPDEAQRKPGGPAKARRDAQQRRQRNMPRQPLTAWQEYAHALLMSNEAWFVQ